MEVGLRGLRGFGGGLRELGVNALEVGVWGCGGVLGGSRVDLLEVGV
jgi:hypothetical protein